MDVTWLPFEPRKTFCEKDRMLARAARDLEHQAARRKPLAQHFGNWLTVAERRRGRTADAYRLFVETALVAHSAGQKLLGPQVQLEPRRAEQPKRKANKGVGH